MAKISPDLQSIVDEVVERLGGRVVLGLPLALGKPNRLVNALYSVTEFYFQSGAALGNRDRQRRYISSNYTHVARDLADRGVNLTLQLISPPRNGAFSLSCNPDVSLDLKKRLDRLDDRRRIHMGQVHPDLPFMHGDAVVDAEFFDRIIDVDPVQPLFALPRAPVSLQDHAVGFHASRLVADAGTLQIGIGSLADALIHSLILRQRDNAVYRRLLDGLEPALCPLDEHGVFAAGLYGASELFMDGFMHLYQAGILKREVFDDEDLQRQANAGAALVQAGTGAVMDGGFFLGSQAFYDFLNGLSDDERPRFRMHGVGRMNQLYGGNEPLEIAQRQHARFINSCMMVTATGAAVSDGLKDHQVVSGVGGQYNFVAMAHAMEDGRSILMLRATRQSGGKTVSNIVWDYPHITIPRHLRDVVVTEYGVADLRGRTDEECIQALVAVMDARFQDELVERAKSAGKLAPDWQVPDSARRNTARFIQQCFGRERFPVYPFGSDFTEVEQALVPALECLKSLSRSKPKLLAAWLRGRPGEHQEALARLGLDRPASLKEKAYARLLASALQASG
ncbi:MAG: acetyl-CoA hydrolase [Xanthomonadaceae bacterium]|nr:acetyl-CoA hydrolase [Xanthomonadaceae bacterium]